MPFIAIIRECVHDDGGKDVWRGDQALRSSNSETHTLVENDGQEICDGVCASGGQAEKTGETPNLQVKSVGKIHLDVESATQS